LESQRVVGGSKTQRWGKGHVMSDERILGDSQFVDSILSRASGDYECRNELRRRRYDLERVGRRVGVPS
jgi:hypothetical protein